MVLSAAGAAVAGVAAGAHELFDYNRENFLYDGELRLKNEFQIFEWRSVQAELWREDIRDVFGLTEQKMGTYLIVSTLQLSMCIGLFAEGRMEPGTPPWLIQLYMLTLGGAFMYLLMSCWLAMHASIVASCSSVRILTQLVRLPIPSWHQLHDTRTFGQSAEHMQKRHLFRVPFVDTARAPDNPWSLDTLGSPNDLDELKVENVDLRRHIQLAKKAGDQHRCYDAFARVAMSFGMNQMLSAISYYVIGYVDVQDGTPVAAFCVVTLLSCISLALVHLDFSLSNSEQLIATLLLLGGPAFTCCATNLWTTKGPTAAKESLGLVLPMAFAFHGAWLLFVLAKCHGKLQQNGDVLPTKFRAVLYLDVFGWVTGVSNLVQQNRPTNVGPSSASQSRGHKYTPIPSTGDSEAGGPSTQDQGAGHSDAYHAFHPGSYTARTYDEDHELVTGHSNSHPGVLPAKIFRVGTLVLIILWFLSVALSIGRFHDLIVSLNKGAELEEGLQEDADESGRTIARAARFPLLPDGKLIEVRWPRHAGFMPRSLSCSPTGSQLVISDDFALYVGELELRESHPAGPNNASVAFVRMAPCAVLDGEELQDIGISCHSAEQRLCHVFVLHAQGRRISECQLPLSEEKLTMGSGDGIATVDGGAPSADTSKEDSKNMAISTSWLAKDGNGEPDQVDAVAINSKLQSRIIVGTTMGQIVQLNAATSDSQLLVPQHAMRQQRLRPIKPGSIHLLPSGAVIMLHHAVHSLQAFDPKLGHLMGEWRLPRNGVEWLSLCGGGSSLFILGLRDGTTPELYRFQVPAELKLEVALSAPHSSPLAAKVVP